MDPAVPHANQRALALAASPAADLAPAATTCRPAIGLLFSVLLAAMLPFLPPEARAEDPARDPSKIEGCVERKVSLPEGVLVVTITSGSREAERAARAEIYHRTNDAGEREVLVRFLAPDDAAGSEFLLLERANGNEFYVRPGADGPSKRITGAGRMLTLAGTDFSYEDFMHLMGFLAGGSRRLEDRVYLERPVYVLELRPREGAYERIVSLIDQKTCVLLRAEYYESGRLRKQLSANPKALDRQGPIWITYSSLMEDLRDSTASLLLVEQRDARELSSDLFLPD